MTTTFIRLTFLAGLFISLQLNAQNPDFYWAKQIGSTKGDRGKAVTVDASGNVYTAGYFNDTADFDPGSGTFQLIPAGERDIFISKLDAEGNFVWAKKMGGPMIDEPYAIALDAAGNIYTTGRFFGTADFDPGNGTFNLTSAGNSDIFISKLDTAGNFVWAKQLKGPEFDVGRAIAVDASGNIFTTGFFQNTVDFDPGTGIDTISSIGSWDAYIHKLDASGNLVWVKQIGGQGLDEGRSIMVDDSGNVFTTGRFSLTADFDPGNGNFNMTSAGTWDVFISKLDAAGNFVWAKQMGGVSGDEAFSSKMDISGNIYTTGRFWGIADFDPGNGIHNLTSAGRNDIYISKLDASGNFLWAINYGDTDDDEGHAISIDDKGNVLTAGFFQGTVDFDPGSGIDTITSAGGRDIFIVKLDSSGQYIWTKIMGGTSSLDVNSMAIDASGNIITTGSFFATADFDPGNGSYNLTSIGRDDVFISKLSCTTTGTSIITACNGYISPSGKYNWTQSGNYTDTISNTVGCDSIITIKLTIILVDTSTAISGNTITSNAVGATYQWLDCNDGFSIIPGAGGKSYNVVKSGSYAVEVAENGCTDTSKCVTLTIVGINIHSANEVAIYPNPTRNGLTIEMRELHKTIHLQIFDLTGRLISSKRFNNSRIIQTNVEGPQGVYFIEISNDQSHLGRFKVIKQ